MADAFAFILRDATPPQVHLLTAKERLPTRKRRKGPNSISTYLLKWKITFNIQITYPGV